MPLYAEANCARPPGGPTLGPAALRAKRNRPRYHEAGVIRNWWGCAPPSPPATWGDVIVATGEMNLTLGKKEITVFHHLNPDDLAVVLDEMATAMARAADHLRQASRRSPDPEPDREPVPKPDLMNTTAVAEMLHVHPQTLRKWRTAGGGPPYIRVGDTPAAGVLHRRSDVEAWLLARRYPHTSAEAIAPVRLD
jgi:hypothetical protein